MGSPGLIAVKSVIQHM